MITRGHYIGEVVDELATIAQQVDTRCALGLTDINRYLEDFFKELLNLTLSLNLANLNVDRSNVPGLDLGDLAKKTAFQVTSRTDSEKIKTTLQKVVENHIPDYSAIYFLIIGTKQKSYSIDEALALKCNFKRKNIWDINDLCKRILVMPLDSLERVYNLVKKDVTRVRIELEIPNTKGEYATSISNYVEKIPKPKLTALKEFRKYAKEKDPDYEITQAETREDFKLYIKKLQSLPRITREFYSFLLEKREKKQFGSAYDGCYAFNYDRLKRICRYADIDGEINLLCEYGFASVDRIPNADEQYTRYVVLYMKVKHSDYFLYELVDYIETKRIGFQRPVVNFDFSGF